ncbi:MAG: universal stress protein, partial [Elusimicrobia bacterium]|nr:universal stress protein [Elusimicrobiota bacterium]
MSAPPAFAPRRILAASDLSPASEAAMRWAALLAGSFDAKLGVVHAHHVEFPPYFSPAQIKTILRETAAAQKRARTHVAEWFQAVCGCPAEALISDDYAIDAVLRTSRSWKADLLVLGTHGRTGVGRLWFGSVAAGAVRRSPR